jgi:hypothetical protein
MCRGDGKTRLVGDVAFQEALGVAGAITPVPGGVGQMPPGEHAACRLRHRRSAETRGVIHPRPASGAR